MALDYNEIIQFMKDFKVDVLNRYDELIIDMPTNSYVYIGGCQDISDVKTRVVYALCRPIGKGLGIHDAHRLLDKLNQYFKTNLTRKDCLRIYEYLCYEEKFEEFKDFINRGFPMEELRMS